MVALFKSHCMDTQTDTYNWITTAVGNEVSDAMCCIVERCFLQTLQYNGQHAANDGEICQQPGGGDLGTNATADGGKEESRRSALPHAAGVRSELRLSVSI